MPARRALLDAFRERAADEGALWLGNALGAAGVHSSLLMTDYQLREVLASPRA
jgi:hypothetical protein